MFFVRLIVGIHLSINLFVFCNQVMGLHTCQYYVFRSYCSNRILFKLVHFSICSVLSAFLPHYKLLGLTNLYSCLYFFHWSLCVLLIYMQFSGINGVLYYTPQILEEAGVEVLLESLGLGTESASFLISAFTTLLMLPCIVVAMKLMDIVGRR